MCSSRLSGTQTICRATPLGHLPEGCGALVARPLEDVEEGGIGSGRAEEVIVPSDFADGLLRKSAPSLLGNTKDSSMQTTIAQSHTSSLFVLGQK
jgi:hypothetical protein